MGSLEEERHRATTLQRMVVSTSTTQEERRTVIQQVLYWLKLNCIVPNSKFQTFSSDGMDEFSSLAVFYSGMQVEQELRSQALPPPQPGHQ